jgi:hypothetical protein
MVTIMKFKGTHVTFLKISDLTKYPYEVIKSSFLAKKFKSSLINETTK